MLLHDNDQYRAERSAVVLRFAPDSRGFDHRLLHFALAYLHLPALSGRIQGEAISALGDGPLVQKAPGKMPEMRKDRLLPIEKINLSNTER